MALDVLVQNLIHVTRSRTDNSRTLVALTGLPASGKSHVAKLLVETINTAAHADIAVVMPMDGYHIPRAGLSQESMVVRGASHTFDAEAFVKALCEIRMNVTREFHAPAFEHAEKDPKAGVIIIKPRHTIVIVEGLYVILDEWQVNHGLDIGWYDMKLFVSTSLEVIRDRIIKRHICSRICSTVAEAKARWLTNDLPNGKLVVKSIVDSKYRLNETPIDFIIHNSKSEIVVRNYDSCENELIKDILF